MNIGVVTVWSAPDLSFFSLPEVRWLLTKPKDVPLNMKDTPTAPLFPTEQIQHWGQILHRIWWHLIKWLVEKWTCLPSVLAMPVFTLSEKRWEILFSCSGLARTTIRMLHSVWMATWMLENGRDGLLLCICILFVLLPTHSPVWSWCLWCSSGLLSLCRPTPSHPKDPPASRWHKSHVGCDLPCRLVSFLGLYTETRIACCGGGWRLLQVHRIVFYCSVTGSVMNSNSFNL